jgi:hypothetical protein
MLKLLACVFPEVGIYWIYPIIIMNLLIQVAFLCGIYKTYTFGVLGWLLSILYIISVLYEMTSKIRNR